MATSTPSERIGSPSIDPGLLRRTTELAIEFLSSLPERPVGASSDRAGLLAGLGGPLPRIGLPAEAVIEDLVRAAEPGLMAIPGPRYFGFVIGGSLPAALAADWLTSTWDQNAGIYACGPAASVVEEVVSDWLVGLLGLPEGTSVGLTTGCQMAHFTCLAAARHAVLARVGWDAEEDGLLGAPEIAVIVGSETHATVPTALQFLGLGRSRTTVVDSDEQGRLRVDRLADALPAPGVPLIVSLQAGNVNTGSFDPLGPAIELIRRHDPTAWIHIDGAFGLWAAASPTRRAMLAGYDGADSWATDGHKWLNVPYDCGYAFVRDPAAHSAAMSPQSAAYIAYGTTERDEFRYVPEYSRRARGFATYAALRSLGTDGVAELVDRSCRLAERMADRLRGSDAGVEILNDVVLDQVLVRFRPRDGGDADAWTRSVIGRVQADGTCWLGGTTWHGLAAMRISVINWSTTEADIDRSAEAIIAAARTAP
ncbi:MAG TPA: pyridoxal-dependent decarboxylase [Candidatus Limnocylindrales bacterium]|nr:pyridoxal-dependent decarboxylase [Candidatus Limnocylindrales bacterium]